MTRVLKRTDQGYENTDQGYENTDQGYENTDTGYLSTDQSYEPKWSVFWKHWPGLRQKHKTLTRVMKK